MSATLQADPRHERRPAGRGAAVGALRGHARAPWFGSTAIATSARRSSSPRRCSCARIGEATDIVEKEMYTFVDELNGESLTLRPEAHRRHRARRDRAQPALRRPAARLDGGPDVPPRAAAEGPLPPVPPVRRRGAGLRGPGRRRRADRDAARGCGRSSACDGIAPAAQLASAIAEERARAPRDAGRVLRGARGDARRGRASAACTPIRCASSTARTRRCRR